MEPRIFVIGILLLILKTLLQPLFWLKSRRKRIALRPNNEPLLLLSATNLAMKIRKKMVSSEEVVKAYIKRIQDVNPVLNAVVEDRFDAAIEDAKVVDKYISDNVVSSKELQETKPLFGVPVTIKESCCVEGLSHSVGSVARGKIKAKKDGEAVRRLKAAGAIPLIVSNTPELCLSWECNNLVTGRTRNCHNANYSSGGSSGGEGALLGAAASVIGLGSDIAGSINYQQCLMGYLAINLRPVDLSTLTVYFMNEVPGYPDVIIPVQQEIKIAMQNAVKYLEKFVIRKLAISSLKI